MTSQTFSITGMHCGACAARVERTIAALPGVESASVTLDSHSAVARFNAPATEAGILAAIAGQGYEAHVTGAGLA